MLLNPIFVVVNAQAVRNANTGQQMMQAVWVWTKPQLGRYKCHVRLRPICVLLKRSGSTSSLLLM
jgi:hypothetical protein